MVFQVALQQLDRFAGVFWKEAGDRKIFAFHGAMGAGKTTLIGALCRYKGVKENTSSPTFAIIHEYSYQEGARQSSIYHIDLYRLETQEEIMQTGVADCLESGALCFVEWAQKAPFLFDEQTVHVLIDAISQEERSVKIWQATTFPNLSIA
jgi:tRNA threonylcarbamoyladenosine biosynthesis protein TsaE